MKTFKFVKKISLSLVCMCFLTTIASCTNDDYELDQNPNEEEKTSSPILSDDCISIVDDIIVYNNAHLPDSALRKFIQLTDSIDLCRGRSIQQDDKVHTIYYTVTIETHTGSIGGTIYTIPIHVGEISYPVSSGRPAGRVQFTPSTSSSTLGVYRWDSDFDIREEAHYNTIDGYANAAYYIANILKDVHYHTYIISENGTHASVRESTSNPI